MDCFCGMADRRKALYLSRRFSPMQIPTHREQYLNPYTIEYGPGWMKCSSKKHDTTASIIDII